MNKNTRKIILILASISACIMLCVLAGTYARYLTAADGTTNISVAKWNIKVNNKSIKNNSDISSAITPIWDSNSNIASGVIAPNATGYFDLNLDFTDADVSCSYKIDVSSTNANVTDLIVTGYSINGGTTQAVTNNTSTTISGNYNYSDTTKTQLVKVYIKWNDDIDTELMNNFDDTKATIINSTDSNVINSTNATTTLDVKVSFTQEK